jgi:wyosine [tRNA(Phe)-imidazoG37] synthetase (radical SAM superfamily)
VDFERNKLSKMTRFLLKLQPGVIYGPINSRRLGSSLGINLLPPSYKVCSFNCAYCQYGFTQSRGHISYSDGHDMPSVAEVVEALRAALYEYPMISYITFSGNGEPTLHPRFSEIVDAVRKVQSASAPEAKLAILSNSSLVSRAAIREALSRLDKRFMKLDAGDERTFRRFNRPHRDIKYADVIAGLRQMKDIIIQALFAGGELGNDGAENIESWAARIAEIHPNECHIYSIDRPTADGRLTLLEKNDLLKIKRRVEELTGITVQVF